MGGGAVARGGEDPKLAALRAERSLNPRPEAVRDEAFGESEFLDARDLVQVKYEMVRRVRLEGESVSRAARAFGFSRQSFYQAAAALTAGGLAAMSSATSGGALAPSAGSRTAIGSGSPCSSGAASPPGRAPGRRPLLRLPRHLPVRRLSRRGMPASSSACSLRWRSPVSLRGET